MPTTKCISSPNIKLIVCTMSLLEWKAISVSVLFIMTLNIIANAYCDLKGCVTAGGDDAGSGNVIITTARG